MKKMIDLNTEAFLTLLILIIFLNSACSSELYLNSHFIRRLFLCCLRILIANPFFQRIVIELHMTE
uniref:Putative ovule protein n=1 Tax=Solanum chacoense TaxID=4108 RepID=A0A0V0GYF4_SOLCH